MTGKKEKALCRSWALAAMLGLSAVAPAQAELIIGLTTGNSLISFDSLTPGSVAVIGNVTGLSAGDTLVGIDRRPSLGANNGVLYGFGFNSGAGTGRIYTLNTSNAMATPGALLVADPADATPPFPFTTVSGNSFGVDFNPVVDRLRVTSNTGQNLRINVDTGLTQLDVPLAYIGGDANFGVAPIDVAVAYSNNFGGATSTILRGVDVGRSTDALVQHLNANAGTLQTLLSLPFDSTASLTSYDISGISGTPFFSASSNAVISQFYAGTTLVGTVGGGFPLIGIAAQVGPQQVPEPGSLALLGLGGLALLATRRKRIAA